MNEMDKSCERADDLISVLYGEAGEREKRDFEVHLKQCGSCRAEFAAFAQVRESIGEWRDEALSGFVSMAAAPAPVRKSAIDALRQFFDLSPLWMKGAVGFAVIAFCVLAVLAFVRLQPRSNPEFAASGSSGAVYTEDDVNRRVKEALAKQALAKQENVQQQPVEPKQMVVVQRSSVKNSSGTNSSRQTMSRRPFSKAERDQLAADLRLLTTRDADLGLLGDRINENQK